MNSNLNKMLTDKQADAYKSVGIEYITKSVAILEKELDVLKAIKQQLEENNKTIFLPTEHGFNDYIP